MPRPVESLPAPQRGPAMNPVALVVGAGDATGGAIARRFAREGYTACVTRRDAASLAPLVAQIEADGGRAVAVRQRCAQGR